MDKNIDIYERTFKFASRVLKMDQTLSRNRRVNRNAMNQLVSSASSIGSNLEEAKAGQSKADSRKTTRRIERGARVTLLAASYCKYRNCTRCTHCTARPRGKRDCCHSHDDR